MTIRKRDDIAEEVNKFNFQIKLIKSIKIN